MNEWRPGGSIRGHGLAEETAAGLPLHARHALKFDTCIAVLALAEATAIVLAAVLAKLFYIDVYLGQGQSVAPYVASAPLLALNLYLFLKQMGLYEKEVLTEPTLGYGSILGALAMAFLVLLGMLYIAKTAEFFSRGWFLSWGALSAVLLLGVRLVAVRHARRLIASGRLRQRIALYGTREYIAAMRANLESSSPALVVAGIYLSNPEGGSLEGARGGLGELESAMSHKHYESILIGLPAADFGAIQTAVKRLSSHSTELLLCTELEPFPVCVQGSKVLGRLRVNVVNLVPRSERNRLLKSALDYVLAVVGIVLLAPLFALVAVAIKIDSPGPVFFRQRRYGQNNRVFRILKFRTMSVSEDGSTVPQAVRGDPRVTRVGRLLRCTSLDELPQLINVLAGEMSIVGPRPHAVAHDDHFETQLDIFSRRRQVRPGLTGWAQVQGLRGEMKTVAQIRDRTEHDLYYVDNWSIWLDMEIITRTVFVLARGAY